MPPLCHATWCAATLPCQVACRDSATSSSSYIYGFSTLAAVLDQKDSPDRCEHNLLPGSDALWMVTVMAVMPSGCLCAYFELMRRITHLVPFPRCASLLGKETSMECEAAAVGLRQSKNATGAATLFSMVVKCGWGIKIRACLIETNLTPPECYHLQPFNFLCVGARTQKRNRNRKTHHSLTHTYKQRRRVPAGRVLRGAPPSGRLFRDGKARCSRPSRACRYRVPCRINGRIVRRRWCDGASESISGGGAGRLQDSGSAAPGSLAGGTIKGRVLCEGI